MTSKYTHMPALVDCFGYNARTDRTCTCYLKVFWEVVILEVLLGITWRLNGFVEAKGFVEWDRGIQYRSEWNIR